MTGAHCTHTGDVSWGDGVRRRGTVVPELTIGSRSQFKAEAPLGAARCGVRITSAGVPCNNTTSSNAPYEITGLGM